MKINFIEYSTCLFMLLMSSFFGIGFYNLIQVSNIDSTISLIIGYFLSFIILLLFIKINNYKPNLNLKDKIYSLFTKLGSKLIIIILSISIFILGIILTYDINNFIISHFLSETPILFTMILLGILVIYINNKGIETITKVSTILFFISILLIIISFVGEYNKVELINLSPILTEGIVRPFKGGLSIIIFNTIYIFILLIIPKDKITNNIKWFIITMTFIFIIFLIIMCFTIGSLGINLTTLYQYPTYIVLKEISIFNFIDKIENFIVIHFIFESFISLSLITYFVHKMLNIKPYIIVISLICFTLFFENNTLFVYITNVIVPISSLIILITMLLISTKIQIKKLLK